MAAVPDDSPPARLWPPEEAQLSRLFAPDRLRRGKTLLPKLRDLRADEQSATARLDGPRGQVFELVLQGIADAQGRPHYSALCSCKVQRFCEHSAALMLRLVAEADAPRREALLQTWVQALRRKASRAELQALPRLPEADAARLLDLLQHQDEAPPPVAAPIARPAPAPVPAAAAAEPARFRPRLILQTLGRGDGLLGLAPSGKLGPRGDSVTVAQVDWTYGTADGQIHAEPAPRSLLNSRPAAAFKSSERPLSRNPLAEAEARDQLWALNLIPLDPAALQWRSPAAAAGHRDLWTLVQEEFFGAFWTEQVPQLEALGWKIETRPGFAHRPAAAERLTLRVDKLSLPSREGAWLLSLGVELDGETLDIAPMIADLLRRDRRWFSAEAIAEIDDEALILLRAPGGRHIEAPARPLKAILGAMVDMLSDPRRAPDAQLRLNDWDASRFGAVMDERSGWQVRGDALGLRRLAERLLAAGTPTPVTPPAGLALQLRPYQLQGLAWLQYLREQGLAGILADDMGLGKTAQTLAHLLVEKQAGRLDRPALAVLPSSLLFNWRAEAARIAPGLRVLVLQGPERAQYFAHLAEYDLVLSSYPLVWRDAAVLQAQPWHFLILDEAQTVKNAASRAAQALRRLRARHRLALTGTPLENHLGELWAQFDFLMPGFLGDARSFQRLWRKPIEEGGESLRAEALARRVRPFVLRRRKSEVAAELPPLTEVTRRLRLEGRQRELYESVRVAADTQVRRVLQRRGFEGAMISVLDALLRLRQVCCDPLLLKGVEITPDTERAKLELLGEMLPELLAEGRRVLVFSQFAEMLGLVDEQLKRLNLPFASLTGATPVAQRAEIVRRFQAEQLPLMLISLKAGGVGLNLTAADTVIHLDPWWNPAVQAQASARAHRIGQDKPVFVYQLIVEGSIEERMLELQRRKLALAEGILGSDTADALKFTPEDLELLLAPLA